MSMSASALEAALKAMSLKQVITFAVENGVPYDEDDDSKNSLIVKLLAKKAESSSVQYYSAEEIDALSAAEIRDLGEKYKTLAGITDDDSAKTMRPKLKAKATKIPKAGASSPARAASPARRPPSPARRPPSPERRGIKLDLTQSCDDVFKSKEKCTSPEHTKEFIAKCAAERGIVLTDEQKASKQKSCDMIHDKKKSDHWEKLDPEERIIAEYMDQLSKPVLKKLIKTKDVQEGIKRYNIENVEKKALSEDRKELMIGLFILLEIKGAKYDFDDIIVSQGGKPLSEIRDLVKRRTRRSREVSEVEQPVPPMRPRQEAPSRPKTPPRAATPPRSPKARKQCDFSKISTSLGSYFAEAKDRDSLVKRFKLAVTDKLRKKPEFKDITFPETLPPYIQTAKEVEQYLCDIVQQKEPCDETKPCSDPEQACDVDSKRCVSVPNSYKSKVFEARGMKFIGSEQALDAVREHFRNATPPPPATTPPRAGTPPPPSSPPRRASGNKCDASTKYACPEDEACDLRKGVNQNKCVPSKDAEVTMFGNIKLIGSPAAIAAAKSQLEACSSSNPCKKKGEVCDLDNSVCVPDYKGSNSEKIGDYTFIGSVDAIAAAKREFAKKSVRPASPSSPASEVDMAKLKRIKDRLRGLGVSDSMMNGKSIEELNRMLEAQQVQEEGQSQTVENILRNLEKRGGGASKNLDKVRENIFKCLGITTK